MANTTNTPQTAIKTTNNEPPPPPPLPTNLSVFVDIGHVFQIFLAGHRADRLVRVHSGVGLIMGGKGGRKIRSVNDSVKNDDIIVANEYNNEQHLSQTNVPIHSQLLRKTFKYTF